MRNRGENAIRARMGRVNVVLGGSGGLSSAKPPPTHIRRQAPAFAIRDKLSRMPPYPVPQVAVTVNPETGQFGFKVWFARKKPHYLMAGAFATKKDALEYLDPHNERVWEEPQRDDASIVTVSTRYKEGAAPTLDMWKK
jgi:hypothetical protein